jgi:hypothetical protein
MACEMQRPAAPTPPPPKQELRRAPWFAHDGFGQLLINLDYAHNQTVLSVIADFGASLCYHLVATVMGVSSDLWFAAL